MHIIFDEDEKEDVMKLVLPEGTTLVERNSEGQPIYSYEVQQNRRFELELALTTDFEEYHKDFTSKEKDEFIKNKNKEDVLNFFIKEFPNSEDYDIPFRHYSAYSDLQYRFLNYIHYNGLSFDEKNDIFLPLFYIKNYDNINKNEAKKELEPILNKMFETYPNTKEFVLDIMEETLSEFGSYYFKVTPNFNFELMIIRFGKEEKLDEASSINDALDIMQKKVPLYS